MYCFFLSSIVTPPLFKPCIGQWTRCLPTSRWMSTHSVASCGHWRCSFFGTATGLALTCRCLVTFMGVNSSRAQDGLWCPAAVVVVPQSSVRGLNSQGVIKWAPLSQWKWRTTKSGDWIIWRRCWAKPCSQLRPLRKRGNGTRHCKSTQSATAGWAWVEFTKAFASRYQHLLCS